MRKFLGTLVLIAMVVAVIGASRDWFSLEKDHEGNGTELHLRIDREKIRADTSSAAEIARELGENIEKKVEERR